MAKRQYDASIVANRLKQLRKEKGITQSDLASGADISLTSVKQYETGKRIPEKFILSKIANYFNVIDDWIIGESEYKTIFEKIDAELGEEGLSELREQVQVLTWLEKNFDFHTERYSAEQLQRLDAEVRAFIQFKIEQLNKENEQGSRKSKSGK